MAVAAKRKRGEDGEDEESTGKKVVSKEIPSWPQLLASIKGDKGEPGAIQALNQLCKTLPRLAAAASSKKAATTSASTKIWDDFLTHWESDPTLKDVLACWERGDQSNNTLLICAALQTYTTILNLSVQPSSGILLPGSKYAAALQGLVQELVNGLVKYTQKYLSQQGKIDLTTASLELVAALLRIVRFAPARNATSRKVWQTLNLDPKVICRLLTTKRKVPLITKHGRKPDVRHLMLSVLLILLAPVSSPSIKQDILGMKGLLSTLFKSLSEDPREVVEGVLECMAHLAALDRLPIELQCRIAEDSWLECIKLYERTDTEENGSEDGMVYPPALTAHRYLLYVISALSKPTGDASSLSSHQRRVLGALIGHLQISDSESQAEIAIHVLNSAPELLPSFWTRFAPSLEPRLSSRWVTSVGFAGKVLASPISQDLVDAVDNIKKLETGGEITNQAVPKVPNIGILLDSAMMPSSLGKTWISKALQTSHSTPLVSFLACNFLYISLRKAASILDALRDGASALEEKGLDSTAWRTAAERIKAEAKDRSPDLQVLIALVQKGLGRAFSRGGSVASTITAEGSIEESEPQEEDNTLLISLALRTIQMYHTLVPSAFSSLRFDFGKLLSSTFFNVPQDSPSLPIAALGQAALLELVSAPTSRAVDDKGEGQIVWQWHKASEGSRSPVAAIIGMYLTTALPSLKAVAEKTATDLLGSSILFEHEPSEARLWIQALPLSVNDDAQDAALSFLDNCIQRCIQTPFKYVDQVQILASEGRDPLCPAARCQKASPLLATLVEQLQYRLGRAESALPYVDYLKRLVVNLAGSRECLCLLDAVISKVSKDASGVSGQGKALQALEETKACLLLLRGKEASSKHDLLNGTDPSDPLRPLYRCLSFLASPSGDSADDNPAVLSSESARSVAGLLLHRLSANTGDSLVLLSAIKKLLDGMSSTFDKEGLVRHVFESRAMKAAFASGLSGDHEVAAFIVELLTLLTQPESLRSISATYAEQLVSHLASAPFSSTLSLLGKLIPILPREQLLSALRLNLSSTSPDVSLIQQACASLVPEIADTEVFQFVQSHWQALLQLETPDTDELVARCVEQCCLPGILPFTAGSTLDSRPQEIGKPMDIVKDSAQWILGEGVGLNHTTSRIVAAAIYRFSELSDLFAKGSKSSTAFADNAPAILARLEVDAALHSKGPAAGSEYIDPAVHGLLQKNDSQLRSYSSRIMLLLQSSSEENTSTVSRLLSEQIPSATSVSPALFDRLSVEALRSLAVAGGIEAFAVLETFVNESLKWLVRRFAEDEENTEQVAEYLDALEPCLRSFPNKWLLRPHLVEPVITAAIQNRLQDSRALSFTATLLRESRLQPTVYTRLLQTLLADSKIRSGLAPSSPYRASLAEVIEAFSIQAPTLLGQSGLNALPSLLAYYGGTLSHADKTLLRIFRAAELKGQSSFRSIVQGWVPPHLRGSCTNPFQVLAALDPEGLHRAGVRVLQPSNRRKSGADSALGETLDPIFFLPLLSVLLDAEELSRSSWLALVESGALSLAICALASPDKQYRTAGDRALAKARNVLSSATEFREQPEILFILDQVRNSIVVSPDSADTLPPVIALFLGNCLRSVASPEEFSYPLIWRFLLSRPIIDTRDLPLFYNLFYSAGTAGSGTESEDAKRDLKWLIKLCREGVQTGDDWRILRKRQAVELFVSYLMSGVPDDDSGLRVQIFDLFAHITSIPSAANDLVLRSAFFSSLSLLQLRNATEAHALLQTVDNCVCSVQTTKLRRARDGLWVADALQALKKGWSKASCTVETTTLASHTLRRLAVYLANGKQDAIDAVAPQLASFINHILDSGKTHVSLSPKAVGDLYDATVRLDYVYSSEGMDKLFDACTIAAVDAGISGLKAELLRSWHSQP